MSEAEAGQKGFADLKFAEFLRGLASEEPTPGGGTASATCGALAAALICMVARLTEGKKRYRLVSEEMAGVVDESEMLRGEFQDLMDEDSRAFDAVMEAIRMPRDTKDEKKARSRALQAATRGASEVPLQILRRCQVLMKLALVVAQKGNVNAASDAFVAAQLARAGLYGAASNVRINLGSLNDEEYCRRVRAEISDAEGQADSLLEEVKTAVDENL